MTQQKLFNYKDEVKSEWVIEQLRNLGMTYTEMADRLKVNRSTLYRFRKGTHRSPEMKKKILDMFNNPHHGVAIFTIDIASPYLMGKVYPVVYCEADLLRQINMDREKTGGIVRYLKYIKRFTTSMIVKHRSIALDLIKKYIYPFRKLDIWLIEQVMLMKTQKTRDKAINLLQIDYKEI